MHRPSDPRPPRTSHTHRTGKRVIVTNKSVLGHRALPGLEHSSCLCLPTPASASWDPSAGTPGQGEEASSASQGGRRGQPLLALAGPHLGRFVQIACLRATSTSARDQSNAYPRSVATREVAAGCRAKEDLAGRGPAAQPRSSGRRNPQGSLARQTGKFTGSPGGK